MGVEENVAVMRRFFDAMNAGDVATLIGSYADDGRCVTMGRTLISGTFDKQQVAMAAGRIYEAFPDGVRFEILDITAQDDRVAIEAESFARHVSGKDYHNEYHFLARLRGGKIVEFKEYCDTEHITDVICGGARPPAATA